MAEDLHGLSPAQSVAPTELSPEEQATIAVFDRATRSVVFIANTAMQRDPLVVQSVRGATGVGDRLRLEPAGASS